MDEIKTEETSVVTQQSGPAQVVKTTRSIVPPPIKTEPPQERYESKKAIFRTYQIIWYLLGIIETLLIFRIVLKASGANELSGFASFIYMASSPFASPFLSLFPNPGDGQTVFELGSLIGCFVYLIVAYGLVQLFQLIKPTTPEEVEENV